MLTAAQLLKLKARNPAVFSKTNRIEELLKRSTTLLTLTDINKINKKLTE
jgi:hypothetical protein